MIDNSRIYDVSHFVEVPSLGQRKLLFKCRSTGKLHPCWPPPRRSTDELGEQESVSRHMRRLTIRLGGSH
jgi:hypothetical protein